MILPPWLRSVLLTLVAVPIAVCTARADFIENGYWMTMSDRLPSGTPYGAFSYAADNGKPGYHVPSVVAPGQILLSYLPMPQVWKFDFHPVPGIWGVDAVAFNTDLSLSPAQIQLPTGWTPSHNDSMNGFGTFTWVARATDPKYRNGDNWLNLVISGLGDKADLRHFTFNSQVDPRGPTPQTPAFYAAHVSGGTATAADGFITEQTIAGTIVGAPEPSTLAICGLGMAAIGAAHALRRYRREL